ncbi:MULTISPECIES: hypothetical protein [unclassified Streptomyces]|uniref:hypothetical protein n=1 Tax=unclassified Streptomyces TaxID=2593676 RepID=UPI0033206692
MPASAALTATAFGVVYGVSLTPVGWRNTMVLGFGGVLLCGALVAVAFGLYDLRDKSTGTRETAVAVCVAVTMFVCWIALKDHQLHERGWPVQAVVTALQAGGGVYDAETEAVVADVSHHCPLGAIGAGSWLSVTRSPSPSILRAGTASARAPRRTTSHGSGHWPP